VTASVLEDAYDVLLDLAAQHDEQSQLVFTPME
jgi:hypothetical protein